MIIVKYDIGVESPIEPGYNLPNQPEIPAGSVVIIGGRAPVWYYGRAFHALHGSPAGVVAVYDPRLGGGVVVASHKIGFKEGDIIPFQW
jgi:CRISPR-associated protein Csx3